MADILVIETGGTIASQSDNGVISLSEKSSHFKEFKDISFKTASPYKILSENLNEGHLELLIKEVDKGLSRNVKGIIILHGSDTLAFSSAMIGLAFAHTKIPIVLTGANRPPQVPGSNATANLGSAITVINRCPGGVYTAYQNSDGINRVYLATRIRSADIFSDDFSDISLPLGYTEGGEFIPINGRLFSLLGGAENKPLPLKDITFKNKIGLIFPFPGLNYRDYSINSLAAVLCATYHSSTVAVAPENSSLTLLAKRLELEGKRLYLAPVKSENQLYETTKAILDLGGVSLGAISIEAALCKLMLAYNIKGLSPEEFLKENRYFETI